MDNWHNVHRHPKTEAKLEELGIIALWQPLYMPQSNPIERLWWHLSEQILRIHRFSDKMDTDTPTSWLGQFNQPSEKLLQMVVSTPAIQTTP